MSLVDIISWLKLIPFNVDLEGNSGKLFNKLIKNLNRKKNFENYVLKPSENHIERLTDEVDKSIGNLYNQIFEFAVQMKDNKDKINMAFNAMMQG